MPAGAGGAELAGAGVGLARNDVSPIFSRPSGFTKLAIAIWKSGFLVPSA